MPYAANGIVQQDPIDGGVEITEDQYLEAVEGMVAGLMVTIDGGFKVIAVPAPVPIVPPVPTLEELSGIVLRQRDYLLSVAAIRIAPLQDAVDLNRATDTEIARLTQWKGYRVDLNRVDQQATFPVNIDWPVAPDAAVV
ncbi:tail fiber assembly protein [Pseudomonas veronii]